MVSQVDQRLANKIAYAIGGKERVAYITRRDIITVLPPFVRTLLWTLVLLALWYAFLGFARDIPSKAIVVAAIPAIWVKFLLVDLLDWDNELLVFTQTDGGTARCYYKRGYWKRTTPQIKLNSLVSTVPRQNRNFSQIFINTADLTLDVFGSEEADLRFLDCPAPFDVIRLASELAQKDK